MDGGVKLKLIHEALNAILPPGFVALPCEHFCGGSQIGAAVAKDERWWSSVVPDDGHPPHEVVRALVEDGTPYPLKRAWESSPC